MYPGPGRAAAGAVKAEDAYAVLREAIDSGRYPPGRRLKEVELGRELGMSRTPIREALRRLQREGAIAITANRGAVVRAVDPDELDDIYSLRAVIEGFCASRAATRMDALAVAQLAAVNAEFERCARDPAASVDTLMRLNDEFHAMIVAGSGNARVGHVLEKAVVVPMAVRRGFWATHVARETAAVYHREIVEAIRAADAFRAEAVMRSHVYAIKDDFLRRHGAEGQARGG